MRKMLFLSPDLPLDVAGKHRWQQLDLASSPAQSAWLTAVFDWLDHPAAGVSDAWVRAGDATDGWRCCADPVSLQPGMDEVQLQTIASSISPAEIQELDNMLAPVFADSKLTLSLHADGRGTLGGAQTLDVFRKAPDHLAGSPLRALVTKEPLPRVLGTLEAEIQMSLHECALNQARLARAEQPINSLWFWGGATGEPSDLPVQLPTLLGNHASLQGLWTRVAPEKRWQGSLTQLLQTEASAVVEINDHENAARVLDWLTATSAATDVQWLVGARRFRRVRSRWWQRLMRVGR